MQLGRPSMSLGVQPREVKKPPRAMALALVPFSLSEWPWTCGSTTLCLSFPIWRVGVLFLLRVAEKPTTLANHAEEETDVTPPPRFDPFICAENLPGLCLCEREGSLTLGAATISGSIWSDILESQKLSHWYL